MSSDVIGDVTNQTTNGLLCDDSCCGGASSPEALLRELGTFSLEWQLDRVLEDLNGEPLCRTQVARRISARAVRDPAFRDQVLRHPRWVYMVALVEAFGVSKLAFLRQIREVRAVQESPTVLYLVLPVEREREEAFLRQVFGGSEPDTQEAEEPATQRERVEQHILDEVQKDGAQRQALLFQPQAKYLDAARELHGGDLPTYLQTVLEIRVVPETPRSLVLVVPAAPMAA